MAPHRVNDRGLADWIGADMKQDTCTVDGCAKNVLARALCSMHYGRLRRWGSVTGSAPRPSLAERLWSRVSKTETCWNWTGSATKSGYGQIFTGGPGVNRMSYTHRLAYELLVAPIPDGLEIDHLCRNQLCCNPKHLEPVTVFENRRRAALVPDRKPRARAEHSYGQGCRCDECKAANTAKCSAYMKRRAERLAVKEHYEREAG